MSMPMLVALVLVVEVARACTGQRADSSAFAAPGNCAHGSAARGPHAHALRGSHMPAMAGI